MQQAQITPQYINQPKDPSWRNGSVKDAVGQLWAVDKAALGMFQQGVLANITYEPPFGNRKYPTIVSVNGQAIGQSQTAGFTPAGQAAQAALPAQAPWQPQTAQSAPVTAPAAPAAPTAMPDTLLSNVLATAVEKGAIQSPNELELWASAIAQAHRVYHGQAPSQSPNPGPAPGPEVAGGIQRLADHHAAAHSGNAQDGPPAGHPAGAPIDDEIPFAPLRDLP